MDVRNSVYKFCKNNITRGKLFTYNHFKVENVPKTIVYRITKRYENGLSAENKKDLKRKSTTITKSKINQLAAYFDNKLLLGMMGITSVTPRMLLQTSSTQ